MSATPVFESGASADHSNLLMWLPTLQGGLPAVPVATGYKLRKLDSSKPSDRIQVCAVMHAAFGDEHGAWTPERVDQVLINDSSVKASFVLESEKDGVIVASASVRILPERFPGAGYLHWVAVHPDHQSHGLGRLVSLAVLHEFVGLGLSSSVLETQDTRLAAITCYERLGYKAVLVDDGQIGRWAEIKKNMKAFRESRKQ